MRFRPYTPADQAACLAIFDSNAARFFAPGDREEFEAFLQEPRGFFGVLCDGELIVGCGGIGIRPGSDEAVLTWGMIHADFQGRGWGKELALARLRKLAEMPPVTKVVLSTSQEALGFYQKMGFQVVNRVPDGYRPGLDRIRMERPEG